jgi:hypothetical protein
MAREMAAHYRQMIVWLDSQAADYEAGNTKNFRGDQEESAILAKELRHRARNLEAIVAAYERLDPDAMQHN